MSNYIKSIRLIPAIPPFLALKTDQGQYRLGIKSLCISLGVSHTGQIQRIRHSPDLAAALVYEVIDTPGGQQRIALLELWGVALWAATLHTNKLAPAARDAALILKRDAHNVVARAFAQQPTETEPAEAPQRAPDRLNSISESPHASDLVRMFAAMGAALETRFTDIETRLAAREQEEQAILVRLKRLDAHVARLANAREGRDALAPTLNDEQQRTLVSLLWSVRRFTGQPFGQLATEVADACGVTDLTDIPQPAWPEIVAWVKRKMDS